MLHPSNGKKTLLIRLVKNDLYVYSLESLSSNAPLIMTNIGTHQRVRDSKKFPANQEEGEVWKLVNTNAVEL